MAYDVVTITLKGAELLAAASAADNIVLAGCDATQTFISKADAMQIENRPVSPYSTTTNVRLSGATDNHLFMRIFFVAGESTGGAANSLYLYGHKQSDPLNDYVIAVMSSHNPFHLPVVGDISNTYGTLLDIIYNPAEGSVSQVTASVYATYGEFADLRDRAVTTHKQGEATVGDNQTIYGSKTFKAPIVSDTGSFAVFDKRVGADFETYYGNYMGNVFSLAGDTFTYASTGLSFVDGKDKHELTLTPNSITNGIKREFEIASTVTIANNPSKLARVLTRLDKYADGNDLYDTGRVILEAIEPQDGKGASIELRAGYDQDDNGQGYATIKTTEFTVNADDLTGNDTGKISLYAANEIKLKSLNSYNETQYLDIYVEKTLNDKSNDNIHVFSTYNTLHIHSKISSSNNAELQIVNDGISSYQVVPIKYGTGLTYDLGSSTYKFDNIYATTFHGALDGNASTATSASSAQYDLNGSPILGYVKTVAAISAGTPQYVYGISVTEGDGTSDIIDCREIIANIVRGLPNTPSSNYNGVGQIALCVYDCSGETVGSKLDPGTVLDGTKLKYAGISYISGNLSIITENDISPGGHWVLLSFIGVTNTSDMPLCLVVRLY